MYYLTKKNIHIFYLLDIGIFLYIAFLLKETNIVFKWPWPSNPFLNILFMIQPFIMIISKRDWIKKEEDIFSNLQIVEKYFYSLFVLVINFRKIRMRISTKNTRKKMHNVFGIIRGSIEPGFLLGRDSIKIIRLIGSIVNWFLNWYNFIYTFHFLLICEGCH